MAVITEIAMLLMYSQAAAWSRDGEILEAIVHHDDEKSFDLLRRRLNPY